MRRASWPASAACQPHACVAVLHFLLKPDAQSASDVQPQMWVAGMQAVPWCRFEAHSALAWHSQVWVAGLHVCPYSLWEHAPLWSQPHVFVAERHMKPKLLSSQLAAMAHPQVWLDPQIVPNVVPLQSVSALQAGAAVVLPAPLPLPAWAAPLSACPLLALLEQAPVAAASTRTATKRLAAVRAREERMRDRYHGRAGRPKRLTLNGRPGPDRPGAPELLARRRQIRILRPP